MKLPARARQAVELLLSRVPAVEGMEIYGTSSVAPGTVVFEDGPEDEPGERFRVPMIPGTHCLLFLEDHPEQRFVHPVRYACVHLETGRIHVQEARRPFTFAPPGGEPRPFEVEAVGRVGDVPVMWGRGDFAGRTVAVSSKTDETSEEPAGEAGPEDVGASSDGAAREAGGGSAERASDEAGGGGEDELVAEAGGSRAPVFGSGGCKKLARVCDFGEKNSWTNALADNMAADADKIGAWLEKAGWRTRRFSQYWGNRHAGFSRGKLKDRFLALLKEDGAELGRIKTPTKRCCHEYFLYLSGHGDAAGLSLYNCDGSGKNEDVDYEDVLDTIASSFPKNVHIIVFVDACNSGALVTTFKSKFKRKFCDKFCAVTLMTVTDDKTSAAGGQIIDSGTEDFLQGADDDHDKDGKKGDIKDRFKEMVRQGSSYKPQSFHCPDKGAWGSLD